MSNDCKAKWREWGDDDRRDITVSNGYELPTLFKLIFDLYLWRLTARARRRN